MKPVAAVAVFLFLTSGCATHQRRYIDGPEQWRRLKVSLAPVVSSDCRPPRVVVKAVINEEGRVVEIKDRKSARRASLPAQFLALIRTWAQGLRFTPLLVDGRPHAVETVLEVPCTQGR